MAEPNRRRSERILLTVPIRVQGPDSAGKKFSETTRTVVINRHGARIQLRHTVAPGALLEISNLVAEQGALFRVVGATQTAQSGPGEWAVECQEEGKNIWGIEFPPTPDEDAPNAILECRRCHTVSLTPLSYVELDVLSASGTLLKDCKTCKQKTTWSTTDKQPGMPAPGEEAKPAVREALGEAAPRGERRRHRRSSLRMPVRLRTSQGASEVVKSENVSKGGIAVTSSKNYKIGEVLNVTCPYDAAATAQNIEVPARVVRSAPLKGTDRNIYGLAYTRET